MVRNIALFVFLLLPALTTHAQLDSQFTFNGQNAETLKAQKEISIVTKVPREVPDTCTRQIPIQERVCRDVTRYRQSCRTIPSSQECRMENERVCRNVTRYREECQNGPSRQECHSTPSRTVCTERPTREVCTTTPSGRQHCTTVGGGTQCTEVGGGTSCNSVPGERICRNVSYTDQDCDNVPRQRCETIPSRQQCDQIPYSENVCGMETTGYRSESYACTRTEYETIVTKKAVKAETQVRINTNGLVEEFPVSVSIIPSNEAHSAFTIAVKLGKEPSVFVVLNRKDVKVASSTDKEVVVKGTVNLEILSKEMLPISLPSAIASATIEKATSKLMIVVNGPISAQGSVDLQITRKPMLGGKKTVAELKAEYPSEKIELGVVGDKAALSINLKGVLKSEAKKKMKMKLTLTSALNLQGELMNVTKPELSKLFQEIPVQLK